MKLPLDMSRGELCDEVVELRERLATTTEIIEKLWGSGITLSNEIADLKGYMKLSERKQYELGQFIARRLAKAEGALGKIAAGHDGGVVVHAQLYFDPHCCDEPQLDLPEGWREEEADVSTTDNV